MRRAGFIVLPIALALALLAAGFVRSSVQAQDTPAASAAAILSYPASPPTPTMGQPPAHAAPALLSAITTPLSPADLLAGWQVVDRPAQLSGEGGRWEEQEGHLYQNGLSPAASLSPAETALLSPATYGDVTIRIAFYDAGNGTVGLVTRVSDRGRYRVRLHTDPTYDGEALVLEKVTDGVAVPLVRNAGEPLYQRRSWHSLTLSVTGGQIVVALDGQIVAQVEDAAPLPAGRVGLYTRALGGISFTDVILSGATE